MSVAYACYLVHCVGVETAIFKKNLSTAFKRCMDLYQSTEQFCKGLLEYIENPARWACILSRSHSYSWYCEPGVFLPLHTKITAGQQD